MVKIGLRKAESGTDWVQRELGEFGNRFCQSLEAREDMVCSLNSKIFLILRLNHRLLGGTGESGN